MLFMFSINLKHKIKVWWEEMWSITFILGFQQIWKEKEEEEEEIDDHDYVEGTSFFLIWNFDSAWTILKLCGYYFNTLCVSLFIMYWEHGQWYHLEKAFGGLKRRITIFPSSHRISLLLGLSSLQPWSILLWTCWTNV